MRFCSRLDFRRTRFGSLAAIVFKEDSKRVGAELKRWSQRPIRATNARRLALCAAVAAMMFIAMQQTSDPAPVVIGMATMFAVMLSSLHWMAMALLRGLARGGVVEPEDALSSIRDPRRISNLDMAAAWTLVALLARQWA